MSSARPTSQIRSSEFSTPIDNLTNRSVISNRNLASEIKNLPEVMECYHIAGLFDYLLKIYSKDMQDYQTFIAQKLAAIPNIGRVQSSFIMTEIKNEKVLP